MKPQDKEDYATFETWEGISLDSMNSPPFITISSLVRSLITPMSRIGSPLIPSKSAILPASIVPISSPFPGLATDGQPQITASAHGRPVHQQVLAGDEAGMHTAQE